MESDASSAVTNDDGSINFFDSLGSLVYSTDANGKGTTSSSSIADRAFSLLDYGVRTFLDSSYAKTVTAPATSAAYTAQQKQLMSLLMVGALALVAYKLLVK